jgi:hypothetical protein
MLDVNTYLLILAVTGAIVTQAEKAVSLLLTLKKLKLRSRRNRH